MRLIDAERLKDSFLNCSTLGGLLGEAIDKIVAWAIKIVDDAPTIKPKRKFIQIITTYYPDDLICYEEYKGKPYFSIAYQENENGEVRVGYGTYNPVVLSRYLRDYFFNEEGK